MDAYYDDTAYIYEEHDDPRCSGCAKPIEDGSVFQFGPGIWHFECFRCAKCNKLIEGDSNLLLLRDGSPICEECSYSCHVCHQSIKDEAIMTGDEAYHADCFRCVQCNTRIEDLVFTQTSKGIFCTSCHEMRKRMRQKRKEERLLQQQNLLQMEPNTQSTDALAADKRLARSRDNKANNDNSSPPAPAALEPKNTILTSNELAELNQMLDNAIESGIDIPALTSYDALDQVDQTKSTSTQGSRSRSGSVRQSDLETELQNTKQRLKEVERKFNKIKNISRKALDEFQVVKESYNAEVAARQKAEEQAKKLRAELAVYRQASIFGVDESAKRAKEEIAKLNETRVGLENICKELRQQRDALAAEAKDYQNKIISHMPPEVQRENAYQLWKQQLRSIQMDIDTAKSNYARLDKARDDIINEMIMLNTKNAELTALNNDLSRRVTEREREALAVMAGTSFLGNETNKDSATETKQVVSLERKSSDHQVNVRKVAQRDSISQADPPKKFKFRRNKGAAVFGRRNNSSKKDEDQIISIPYDSHHGRPLNTLAEPNANGPSYDLKDQPHEPPEQPPRPGRPHNLLQTKFLRSKCEVCNDTIWRTSELKCQECGFVCHYKCMHTVGNTCGSKSDASSHDKDAQKARIFGNELIAQVRSENGTVPLVVQTCVEAVEARGMDFEGIYRKSGAAGQMRLLQQAFEKGDILDLANEDQWNDICSVTSVLKQYFRDLPNPLFTYELHSQFMEATGSSDQANAFRQLLLALPVEHYQTLKYLMHHLDKIQQRHKENLMTSRNLAVIFGPTLMRHRDDNRDLVDMNRKISAIEFILNHIAVLFAEPSPTSNNHSSPLPTNSNSAPRHPPHRREMSAGNVLRAVPPALPPREKPGYI